jgi:hypothetical protein
MYYDFYEMSDNKYHFFIINQTGNMKIIKTKF